MTVPEHTAGNSRIRVLTPVEVRAERYRAHAVECTELARHALNRDDVAILEDTAMVWRHLAELVERFELV
jgi:hypothetical protein